jgi:hypothetical protein
VDIPTHRQRFAAVVNVLVQFLWETIHPHAPRMGSRRVEIVHKYIRRDWSRRSQRTRFLFITVTYALLLGRECKGIFQYANAVSLFYA